MKLKRKIKQEHEKNEKIYNTQARKNEIKFVKAKKVFCLTGDDEILNSHPFKWHNTRAIAAFFDLKRVKKKKLFQRRNCKKKIFNLFFLPEVYDFHDRVSNEVWPNKLHNNIANTPHWRKKTAHISHHKRRRCIRRRLDRLKRTV